MGDNMKNICFEGATARNLIVTLKAMEEILKVAQKKNYQKELEELQNTVHYLLTCCEAQYYTLEYTPAKP